MVLPCFDKAATDDSSMFAQHHSVPPEKEKGFVFIIKRTCVLAIRGIGGVGGGNI